MRTACGITGIVVNNSTLDISDLIAVLHTIQHRGQSSWGVACLDNGKIRGQTRAGLLPNQSTPLRPHPLACCIGHVGDAILHQDQQNARGEKIADGAQPVLGRSLRGNFAVSFNGQLGYFSNEGANRNIQDIQRIITGIAEHPSDSWIKVLHDVVANCVAAFTLVILTDQGLFYARDLRGYRPLVRADITVSDAVNHKPIMDCHTVVSEECGHIELRRRLIAKFPKAIVEIKSHTVQPSTIGHIMLDGRWKEWAVRLDTNGRRRHEPKTGCSLEAIHFMDSSGEFDGLELERFREVCGRELALTDRVNRDIFPAGSTIVVGCPRSGILCGKGYAAAARLPYVQLIRVVNKVSRSGDDGVTINDTSPRYQHRKRKSRPRLVLGHDVDIAGKTVVIVDDVIITGATLQNVVQMLRAAHASEVHIRIATPALRNNCNWGTVLPDVEDLLSSAAPTTPLAAQCIGVNSFKYLSVERFGQLTGPGYCQECFFTSDAPTAESAGRAPSPIRTREHTKISLPDST